MEALQTQLTKVEATSAVTGRRLRRERDRAERMVTQLLKATADAMEAKETEAKLQGELVALRSLPKPETVSWWRWLGTTG
jgi:hypothetical protein